MKFRCFTWNTAKRLKYTSDQVHFIEEIGPDIVALQEIIMSSDKKFKELLKNNYPYIVSSFDLVEDKSVLSKKRMFGEIIASKFPLEVQDPNNIDVPWKERVLSAKVILKNHKINFHTTHIPPGSQNGWIKIETLEGIYNHLVNTKESLNILCGDFNAPKDEDLSKGLITFAQRINKKGDLKTPLNFRKGDGNRWDEGERNIFLELEKCGMKDSFRSLYSYKIRDFSWQFKRKDKILKRRFDHFFASNKFRVLTAKYLHNEKKLSDHSPMLVEYGI